jgi:CheY-like chemotaxis protein
MAKTKWILLAEDNEIDADLAIRTLSGGESAYEVVLASDGLKALDCLYRRGAYENRPAGPPAVVILDIKMPKVDGLEVLRQIKSDPRLKTIPVVMFTSSREEIDLTCCYERGANAYIVKPMHFAEFRTVLQQVRAFWLTMNELPPGDLPSSMPNARKALLTTASAATATAAA